MSKSEYANHRDDFNVKTSSIVEMTQSSSVDEPTEVQEVNNRSQNASGDGTLEVKTGCVEDVTLKSPLKKNVKFPGDSPVASYLEPPNPWKNAPQWTSLDLINSYRASCKKHNTKPINSVLSQLQMIDNVGERYAILSLKGEKLDMKNVETLEEIFKLVQFQCVDLEGTHLDEETSVAIFEMIEYYESACKVNVSFNKNISIRGWQACSRMIRKTPDLTFLDARNCDINERVLPVLGRALKMGCFLKILHLENTNMSGRPLVILVAALKMNEILKELFLADNKLMPSDGIQIGSLLKYNHTLELLDLRNNHLQDIGVGHICDGLYEQNLYQGLNTLVMWNNLLTYQSMTALAKALTSTKNLETLNIGHNSITNEGIHLLKEGLLQNKSLLRLGLQGTKVTCEGAVALAEVIADSPRLVRVDLRENEIKTAGMMALSLALKVNNILHRLDMDKDTKKEAGIKDYADQQRRLQQEINSKLEQNRELFYKLEQEKTSKRLEQNKDTEKQNEDVPFIEPCNKVRRPSLLMMPDCPREASLDSPHTVEPTHTIPSPNSFITSKELLHSPQYSHSISTPPGELLLSPQYCPSVKARKIFTVSKVNNSTMSPMAPVPSILPPVIELPMALPPSLPVMPIQPVIINSDNIPDDSAEGQTGQLQLSKVEQFADITNALVTESVNQILDQIISNDTSSGFTGSSGSSKQSVNHSVECNSDLDVSLQQEKDIIEVGSIDIKGSEENVTIETLEGNEVCSVVLQADTEYNNALVCGNIVVENTGCDNVQTTGDVQSNKVQTNSSGSEHLLNGNIEQIKIKEIDSGVGSYDNELWTNVEDTVKPNFQTSLTLNGLTQELASAIEGLDVSSDGISNISMDLNSNADMKEGTSYSSPDDFERELDEMLANVTKGNNIFPGSFDPDSAAID